MARILVCLNIYMTTRKNVVVVMLIQLLIVLFQNVFIYELKGKPIFEIIYIFLETCQPILHPFQCR